MRIIVSVLFGVVLALGVVAPSEAQLTCEDIVFDAEATANYPEVADACLEVVTRGGGQYARFHARVRQRGNESVVLQYEHRDGSWGEPVRVTPPEGFRFILDGRPVRTHELERGQELNVYLLEGRWRLAITDLAPVETLEVYPEPLPHEAAPEIPAMEPEEEVTEPEEEATEPPPAAEPAPAGMEEELQASQPEEGGPSMIILLFAGLAILLVAFFLIKRRDT